MKNKIVSLIMTTLILFSIFPNVSMVYADSIPASTSGTVGKNNEIEWTFDNSNGKLSFELKDGYSSGEIPSYSYYSNGNSSWSDAPWNYKNIDYRPYIVRISIGKGITTVGNYSFVGMSELQSLRQYSVTEYGEGCFKNCPKLHVSRIMPSVVVDYSSIEDAEIVFGESCFENSANTRTEFANLSFGSTKAFNIISIQDRAFANSGLSMVELFANEIYIGQEAFAGAFNNQMFSSGQIQALTVRLAKQNSDQVSYTITVPAKVISIKQGAFSYVGLDWVQLSASELYEIHGGAFYGTDINHFYLETCGYSPKIILPNTNEFNPVICSNCLRLGFAFGTQSNVVIPEFFFNTLEGLISMHVNGNVIIEKNNFIANHDNNECRIYFDGVASNLAPSSDIFKDSNCTFLINAKLASNVHKFAIENGISFASNDDVDFGQVAPTLLNIDSNINQDAITFNWSPVTCSEYYIYRRTSSNNEFTKIASIPFYKTQFTDSNLISGEKYLYKIIPYHNDKFGLNSNILEEKLMNTNKKVTGSVKVVDNKNVLTFVGIGGANKYNIYSGTTLVTTINANSNNSYSYTFNDVIQYGKEYKYSVEPIRDLTNGTAIGIKTLFGFTPTVALSKPNLTVTDKGFGKVLLSWKKDNNASGYKITKVFNGITSTINIANPETTSYELNFSSGGLYKFNICSYRDYQNSIVSDTIEANIMLKNAPTLSYVPSNDTVKLTWTSIAGADEYVIEKFDNEKWTKLIQTKSTTYTDKGLLYGKEYKYRVYGIKNISNIVPVSYKTSCSDEIPVKTSIAVGNTTLSITKSTETSVVLSWLSATNANKYEVYRKIGNSGKFSLLTTVTSLTFTDTKLEKGKTYIYAIRPYRDYCISPNLSNTISYTTLSENSSSLTTIKQDASIKLIWKEIIGADSYDIYRKDNGEYKLIYSTSDLSYLDNNVSFGQLYSYKIIPMKNLVNNGKIYGTYSNESTILLIDSIKETGIKVTKKIDNSIHISWNEVEYATEYVVLRKIIGGDWEELFKTTNTSYLDNDINNSKSYQYNVIPYCYSMKGPNSISSTIAFMKNDISIKLTPNQKMHTTKITISTSSPVGMFEVYKRAGGKKWELLVKTKNKVINDSNCSHGKSYEYKVRIFEDVSDGTIYSEYSSTRIVKFDVSVKSIKLKLKGKFKSLTKVTLTWSRPNGVKTYKLYRKVGSGKWKQITTTKATTYTNKGLKRGVKYLYKIIPQGSFDTGKSSNIVSLTTLSNQSIKIKAIKSSTSVKLSWKGVAGSSGYEIYGAADNNPKFKKYATTTKKSKTIKNIKKNNTYYFFVRPYKVINNKKVYGKKSYVAIVR